MGNRLSKIATKTGDKGETGLGDGSRISKSSERIHAIGEVDELNSWVGMLRAELSEEDELIPLFHQIQHDLFDIGGELSVPGFEAVTTDLITDIEQRIEQFNQGLPPLKNFILPGGNKAAATCHMARACCRRAERSLVVLSKLTSINNSSLVYLNRLSDLLFILARVLARRGQDREILWQSRHDPAEN